MEEGTGIKSFTPTSLRRSHSFKCGRERDSGIGSSPLGCTGKNRSRNLDGRRPQTLGLNTRIWHYILGGTSGRGQSIRARGLALHIRFGRHINIVMEMLTILPEFNRRHRIDKFFGLVEKLGQLIRKPTHK